MDTKLFLINDEVFIAAKSKYKAEDLFLVETEEKIEEINEVQPEDWPVYLVDIYEGIDGEKILFSDIMKDADKSEEPKIVACKE